MATPTTKAGIEEMADQILRRHVMPPALYVDLRATIVTALEVLAEETHAGLIRQANDQMRTDCRASCHMCRTGSDVIAGQVLQQPIERGPVGNWDHESFSVPGLYAHCFASNILGDWVGRPGRSRDE